MLHSCCFAGFKFKASVRHLAAKLKKQFDYAERKAIPFLSITGASEMEQGIVNLKNLASGEQKSFEKEDIAGIRAFLQQ